VTAASAGFGGRTNEEALAAFAACGLPKTIAPSAPVAGCQGWSGLAGAMSIARVPQPATTMPEITAINDSSRRMRRLVVSSRRGGGVFQAAQALFDQRVQRITVGERPRG
jgi:hypothetical protein